MASPQDHPDAPPGERVLWHTLEILEVAGSRVKGSGVAGELRAVAPRASARGNAALASKPDLL